MAVETPISINKNMLAIDFNLKSSLDDKFYSFNDLKGENGTVVVFMCNHCPYVKSIINKITFEYTELKKYGVNFIGINSNDTVEYPEDSYDNMKTFVKDHGINFHYLFDEDQKTAKDYGAVCTPDFFGFNKDQYLRYRGRLDSSKKERVENLDRDLFFAMKSIAETGDFNGQQIPSIGCSIKWK